jgi:oxygen-independent coproporphyrinogen-3 oxidase
MSEFCFAGVEATQIASVLAPEQLISRYSGRVPRYTSYPTAAQFGAQADDTAHRAWLHDIDPDHPVSLYFHIPFCDRLCWYCGCHTGVVNTRPPVERYVAALATEIELVADALPARVKISAIHFGGGTPNMLAPEDLTIIFGALRRRFDLLPHAEIAAELDPSTLTPEWVQAAQALGLNRASLGVQDFDPLVQAAINRPQSFECVANCVSWLRDAGVVSINLDLMYGLPHQTRGSLITTIAQAASLAPDRVALFGYAHVPWMKPAQKLLPEAALPPATERFAQAQAAAEKLQSIGYARIGLDHFARSADSMAAAGAEGALKRNFQGYTTDAATSLLGFGASAISKLPGGYAQNHASTPAWRACIDNGRLPTGRGVDLTADDITRAAIIEQLMCNLAVDLHENPGLMDGTAKTELAAMETHGLVIIERCHDEPVFLRVTETGRPFVRNVCTLFDAYLRTSKGRHSSSV